MLRVAVPNKGSLSGPATAMLHEAGYTQRGKTGGLVIIDEENDVEFFYLRPRDIAVYVGSGRLDLGITGRDLLIDSGAAAEEALALGFARSTFYFAAAPGTHHRVDDLDGQTIATSYPGLVAKHLADHGVHPAGLVRLDGAVETSLRLGVADAIADVVETGRTLAQLNLVTFGDPIMVSEAIVIRPANADTNPAVQRLLRRLHGVGVARDYRIVDYIVADDLLDRAVTITPGLESPTISRLHRPGQAAVRAVVPASTVQAVMDDLEALGATAILAAQIHACRL
ncbi:ATP phosphoribosyltransferase [Frankia sp. Ag45/Mut15]|uniref:ATP phosphoribosyltransferase n=1 Tax=Frankia umida TaxID=573489 RepID=A0ABT0K247_9ACTN|nr:ATP phosphoribosyltransferase [Frankia umida]MCK9877853.1 ATP phosphoribosyltransferase [Frankia umida]